MQKNLFIVILRNNTIKFVIWNLPVLEKLFTLIEYMKLNLKS